MLRENPNLIEELKEDLVTEEQDDMPMNENVQITGMVDMLNIQRIAEEQQKKYAFSHYDPFSKGQFNLKFS